MTSPAYWHPTWSPTPTPTAQDLTRAASGVVSITPGDPVARILSTATAGTTYRIAAGTYTLTATITVATSDVTIRAERGAKFVTGAFDALNITGDRVLLEGLEVDGSRSANTGSFYHGITVGGDDCRIVRCRVHDTGQRGINGSFAHRLMVFDCECHDNGNNGTVGTAPAGIYLDRCELATIMGCRTYNNGTYGDSNTYDGDGIYVRSTSASAFGRYVSIIGNRSWHNARGGIKAQSTWATITGNVCTDNSAAGIRVNNFEDSSRCTVSSNICVGGAVGFQIDNCPGSTFVGNHVENTTSYGYFITIGTSGGASVGVGTITVSGGTVIRSGGDGVYCQGLNGGTFTGLQIVDAGWGGTADGFYFNDATMPDTSIAATANVLVTGCTVRNKDGATTLRGVAIDGTGSVTLGANNFGALSTNAVSTASIVTTPYRQSIIVPATAGALYPGGTAWPTANKAILQKFTLEVGQKLRYVNWPVNTQSGNIQVGVVRLSGTSFTRVMDSGVIACPAAGDQHTDLGATWLAAGDYAVFLWANNTTFTTRYGSNGNISVLRGSLTLTNAAGVPSTGTVTIDSTCVTMSVEADV